MIKIAAPAIILSFLSCSYPPTKPLIFVADETVQAVMAPIKSEQSYPLGVPMIEVEGNYCQNVSETCLDWIDKDATPTSNSGIGHLRCATFKNPSICLSTTRKHLHFLMAKFEYPGTEGSYPLVGVNYYQAKSMAEKDGKRLCTEEEFNFACEGEEIHPYGYGDGYHRDSTICNIDKPWVDFNNYSPETWNDVGGGIYQAVKSSSNSKCKTTTGIININGNIDELLDSENSKNEVLSGGYWGPVRDRCLSKTKAHGKDFSFYQIGFRECANIK
jgi:sulfatase modifying factor 1